ncbi:glycosyltransferase family 2 protein [Caproiciproducens sp. LBM24188]
MRLTAMQLTELSIIIPVRNIEREIQGILSSVAAQTAGHETEFIIVDMGSTDQTVLEAVQTIKEQKLRGFVIQNGDGAVSAALNTGMQKSGGEYITFIFARRLYRNFIHGYLDTAARTSADFIYGSVTEADSAAAERRLLGRPLQQENGIESMKKILRGMLPVDISAILVRRSMILGKRIRFFDHCEHGYAEEFVYRCLLSANSIAQSPTVLKRDVSMELKRGKQKAIGKAIFQHTDAMLRILDHVKAGSQEDPELTALLEQNKIPQTIMDGVDIMLREGAQYNAVRAVLRAGGYDKLLVTGRHTSPALKRRVKLWQFFPWLYKAK